MKKLLAVAAIGLAGYKVVKKIKERKDINEEEVVKVEVIDEEKERQQREAIKKVAKPVVRPFVYAAVYGAMVVKAVKEVYDEENEEYLHNKEIVKKFNKVIYDRFCN